MIELPGITAPPGLPCFLAAGHGINEDSVYAQVKFIVGHSRARRVRTVPERFVTVSWFLEAEEMAAVDLWYEDTLQAGALPFSAHVADQGAGTGLLWWWARWREPYSIELLAKGRGRLTGVLFLRGEGSETPPDTSTLEGEIRVALLQRTATVGNNTSLAGEISVALTQPVTLSGEIRIALNGSQRSYLLREDSDRLLREDGSNLLRE